MKPYIFVVVGRDNNKIACSVATLQCDTGYLFPEAWNHPSKQFAVIRELICKALDTKQRIVIATHSEAIINGIGDRIETASWPHDAFQIIIADSKTTSGYTPNGALREDWPFGFMAPVED